MNEIVLAAPAFVASTFALICVGALALQRRSSASAERSSVPVFVLRPVERVTPSWLSRTREEANALGKEGLARVVVCGPPELRAARASSPELLFAESEPIGEVACNRKVRHLARGAALARASSPEGEVIVIQVDADVHLDVATVRALLGTLEASRAHDVAFAFPALAAADDSLASRGARTILMATPQSFAVVDALARVTRTPPAVAGKCVALRLSTLDAMGGYSAIERAIGDDVALVEKVRALGGDARPIDHAVATSREHEGLAELLDRMTRWLRVIRAQRPLLLVTYPILIAPLPTSIVLAIAGGVAGSTLPLLGLAALIVTRMLLALVLAFGPYRELKSLSLVSPVSAMVADAVLSIALLLALRDRKITWAGRVYDLDPRGEIRAVRTSAPIHQSTMASS